MQCYYSKNGEVNRAMSFKEIVELIERINNSQISLMELNYENLYLKLDKSLSRTDSNINQSIDNVKSNSSSVEVSNTEKISNSVPQVDTQVSVNNNDSIESDENSDYITSPMVGTVYLASAPNKPPYISKGQTISAGDIVCIIEAMKLMNEIESEFSGEVLDVLVKNGQMVEFGQKLFKVKKN